MTSCRQIFVAAVAACACAVSLAQDDATDDDEELNITEIDASEGLPPSEAACFNRRDVRNFDALSDRFIYLQGRRDEHFLLTTDGSCFALRGAFGIAISSQMSRICSRDLARVSYQALGQVESCRIRQVERVDSKEAAERIAESREDARR